METDAIALHEQGVRFQRAGQLREAAEAYEAALALTPGLELARSNLALVRYQLGENEASIAHYQTLLAEHPFNAKARFNLGVVYASIGQLDQAAAEYRQVLTLEPGHAMALANLAWLLQQQHRFGEAVSALERLHQLTPDDLNVLYQLGNLHKQVGDHGEAEACWQQVTNRDPRHVPALIALADLARQRQDDRRTLSLALDALAIDPQHPAAMILAARAHVALLEYGEASRLLTELAERFPNNAEVRYHLGVLASLRRDFGPARLHLAEACRLAPQWLEAHLELGAVFYQLGLYDDAIDHFRMAEGLAPANAVIKANIGYAYLAIGEREAAAQYFEAYEARPSEVPEIDLAVRCALDLA
ncbi:MAG: tetratricopeptide repeat protein [Candidatus Sericytochromatia bacterium]|nr:tetratricopeptide repeat protein [Candidatus Sericytochromatia bacterium]